MNSQIKTLLENISQEHEKCKSLLEQSQLKYVSIAKRLATETDVLTQKEYSELYLSAEELRRANERLSTELSVWDKVEEICSSTSSAAQEERWIEIIKKINYKPYPDAIEANVANQFTDYALRHIVREMIKNGIHIEE